MLRPVRATSCYNDFGHEVVAGGEVYPVQALVHRAIRLDHTVRQAYVDHHFAAGVPPDTARWMTAHAATTRHDWRPRRLALI